MPTPIEQTNLQSESADSEMINSHRPFKPMLNKPPDLKTIRQMQIT